MALEEIIGFLDNYGDTAINGMSMRTMASITWIIHMQSQHFAAGLMVPPHNLIPEFVLMSTSVQTKQEVTYGDVPVEMYEESQSNQITSSVTQASNTRKRQGVNMEKGERKRPQIIKMEHYNNFIKTQITPFEAKDKLPRVRALFHAANINPIDLFSNKPNLCIKSTLFGTCINDCKRDHIEITTEEATFAMNLLKPAISNPETVKVTK